MKTTSSIPRFASSTGSIARLALPTALLLAAALSTAACDDGTGSGNGGGGGATGGNGGTTANGGNGGSGGSGGAAGGNGGGESACFDYSGFDGATPVVSFKTDVLPILQRSCGITTSCHGDPNMPNENRPYWGPKMTVVATPQDIALILAGTVGVPSYNEPAMNIITPGDPAHSFVLHKLDHTLDCSLLPCAATKSCGSTMPQGSEEPLPQDERDLIRRWIAQGAQNN